MNIRKVPCGCLPDHLKSSRCVRGLSGDLEIFSMLFGDEVCSECRGDGYKIENNKKALISLNKEEEASTEDSLKESKSICSTICHRRER